MKNLVVGNLGSPRVSGLAAAALGMSIIGLGGSGWGFPAIPMSEPSPKPKTKCGLPSCNIMSERDYCSAAHCKKHAILIRERQKNFVECCKAKDVLR